jgi:NAD+--asparagine ADP-ribosyltransferase
VLLITNNPRFKNGDFLENNLDFKATVFFSEITYIDILKKVREYVHKNYKLLTHPLYGSVKPNETIYRTVILKEGKELDYDSVRLIEDAIYTAEKFLNNKKTPDWSESIKEDFQVIDYDIIMNTINRIKY